LKDDYPAKIVDIASPGLLDLSEMPAKNWRYTLL